MEVLRPEILRIGRRCYRRNPIANRADAERSESRGEIPSEFCTNAYEDEICGAGVDDIKQLEDGSFKLYLEIPSAYFRFVIGKKGDTKRKIESETRTQIRIPRQGMEGDIVVTACDKAGISSARTRINVLVDSARQKQAFTHFLCISASTMNIQEKMQLFKSQVLDACAGDRGIDCTIFQNPTKLHLTIGTLALMNEKEIESAINVLKECRKSIIDPLLEDGPLLARMVGLEYMNDDPHTVDVLYGKVTMDDASDRLQCLADELSDRLTSSGVMQKSYDRVKLHVTLMNTLFRKDPEGVVFQQKISSREPFDASNVLKIFGEYDFGPLEINDVHLVERYSTQSNGFYKSAYTLNF